MRLAAHPRIPPASALTALTEHASWQQSHSLRPSFLRKSGPRLLQRSPKTSAGRTADPGAPPTPVQAWKLTRASLRSTACSARLIRTLGIAPPPANRTVSGLASAPNGSSARPSVLASVTVRIPWNPAPNCAVASRAPLGATVAVKTRKDRRPRNTLVVVVSVPPGAPDLLTATATLRPRGLCGSASVVVIVAPAPPLKPHVGPLRTAAGASAGSARRAASRTPSPPAARRCGIRTSCLTRLLRVRRAREGPPLLPRTARGLARLGARREAGTTEVPPPAPGSTAGAGGLPRRRAAVPRSPGLQ